METRANHLAVGAFVLVAILGAVAFIVWLGKTEISREVDRYYIYFTGSVSGLTEASTVRYRGVPVGKVVDIRIDPDNSERVRVLIEVEHGTPIKVDSVATLEMQGITGLVDIQIKGGSRDAPLLRPRQKGEIPVIASTPSKIEQLLQGIPQALATFSEATTRVSKVLNDENIAAITATLDNLRTISGTVADSAGSIRTMVDDVATTAAEIRRTAATIDALARDLAPRLPSLVERVEATLERADQTLATVDDSAQILTDEAVVALDDVRRAAVAFSEMSAQIDSLVADTRPGLRDFSSEGLFELTRFLIEARALVANLTRITDRFEADPARFLFGDQAGGFEPQQ